LPGCQRVELRVRVGQGEDDRGLVHDAEVVGGEQVGGGGPDEDVGAPQRVAQRPGATVLVGAGGDGLQVRVLVPASVVDDSVDVDGDDVGRFLVLQQPDDGRTGGPHPADDDAAAGDVLVVHTQRVAQRGQHHDRRAVLVVVEHRDVQLLPQARLDFQAAGSRDGLQDDAAVDRCDQYQGADDLDGALAAQAQRPGVDPGELLEQRGLSFHHRQRCFRTEVAQAEHGRAVGDHGDGVALDREPPGVFRVLRDRGAHPGHAGGVGAGEVVAVGQGDPGVDLYLAAQVHQEGAVRDLAHPDPVQGVQHLGEVVGVIGGERVAGDVDDDAVAVRLDDVERRDHTARAADGTGQVSSGRGGRRGLDAAGDRITGTWNRHGHTPVELAMVDLRVPAGGLEQTAGGRSLIRYASPHSRP